MELKEFIENFAEQFDDTDASEIQADTEFHELDEWGSLTGMGVIAPAPGVEPWAVRPLARHRLGTARHTP